MKDIIIIGANRCGKMYNIYYRNQQGKKGCLTINGEYSHGLDDFYHCVCPFMSQIDFALLPFIEKEDNCGVKSTLLSS